MDVLWRAYPPARLTRPELVKNGIANIWWFEDGEGVATDPQVFLFNTGEYFCMEATNEWYGEEKKIAGPFTTLEEAQAVALAIYRLEGKTE